MPSRYLTPQTKRMPPEIGGSITPEIHTVPACALKRDPTPLSAAQPAFPSERNAFTRGDTGVGSPGAPLAPRLVTLQSTTGRLRLPSNFRNNGFRWSVFTRRRRFMLRHFWGRSGAFQG